MVLAAFNQQKALVAASSVIGKTARTSVSSCTSERVLTVRCVQVCLWRLTPLSPEARAKGSASRTGAAATERKTMAICLNYEITFIENY